MLRLKTYLLGELAVEFNNDLVPDEAKPSDGNAIIGRYVKLSFIRESDVSNLAVVKGSEEFSTAAPSFTNGVPFLEVRSAKRCI